MDQQGDNNTIADKRNQEHEMISDSSPQLIAVKAVRLPWGMVGEVVRGTGIMTGFLDRQIDDRHRITQEAAFLLRRCGNPDRLAILLALTDGERSVHELAARLQLRQPALSQQLAELRRCRLIDARRASRHVFYRLIDERAAVLLATLYGLFDGQAGATGHVERASNSAATALRAAGGSLVRTGERL